MRIRNPSCFVCKEPRPIEHNKHKKFILCDKCLNDVEQQLKARKKVKGSLIKQRYTNTLTERLNRS